MKTKQLRIKDAGPLKYFVKEMIDRSMWFSVDPAPDGWWIVMYKPEQQGFIDAFVEKNNHYTIHKEEEIVRALGMEEAGCKPGSC